MITGVLVAFVVLVLVALVAVTAVAVTAALTDNLGAPNTNNIFNQKGEKDAGQGESPGE